MLTATDFECYTIKQQSDPLVLEIVWKRGFNEIHFNTGSASSFVLIDSRSGDYIGIAAKFGTLAKTVEDLELKELKNAEWLEAYKKRSADDTGN